MGLKATVNELKAIMKRAPGRNVYKIDKIIQLYESRKIPNITIALNIVSALSFQLYSMGRRQGIVMVS